MVLAEQLSTLQQVGLTAGELKVYKALLEIGETTKTKLVAASGVTAANMYDITNRLAEKGIISIMEKNGVKHFFPAHPRSLNAFIQTKKEELTKEETIVRNIMPVLQEMYKEQLPAFHVETYVGWKGLATVFTDLLEECSPKDTNYVIGASMGERPERVDEFFLKYSRMRKKKGIPLKIIFTEALRKRKERVNWFIENAEVKFLIQHSTSEVMVYKDTTVLLILSDEPVAIRMRGNKVADSFKEQFKEFWRVAKR